MFKTPATPKGTQSAAHLLEISLDRFRRDGLEQTTMRDIAQAAGLAPGAFYYYYPSKEAIVLAYYERVQREHEQRVQAALAGSQDLRERLAAVFHSKIDILAEDRSIMGALLRYTGEPAHPLSFLGPATRPLREQSRALFRRALEGAKLPPDLEQLLPSLFWTAQMGILLYFLYDESPRQKKTRALIDRGLDLAMKMLSMAKLGIFRPVRKKIWAMLAEADLLPGADGPGVTAPAGGEA